MDLESFKCPKCDFKHANINSLRIHWQKIHKKQSIDLRIALFGRPTCECGCREQTDYRGLVIGFARFVNGHNARVNNGWGHNKKALEKSLNTRQEMWKNGEISNPFRGLTKENNEELRLRGEKVAASFDDEKRIRYAQNMKKNRRNGRIPTQYGKNSSQWKGGTSALQPLVRSRVFNAWTYPKLKSSNFTCQRCSSKKNSSSKKNLEVHHDKERFADILQKAIVALGEPGDSFEQKVTVAD